MKNVLLQLGVPHHDLGHSRVEETYTFPQMNTLQAPAPGEKYRPCQSDKPAKPCQSKSTASWQHLQKLKALL